MGRVLYTNETIQVALFALDSEVRPDWVLPDASPEFRKRLALDLFYKFVLATAPPDVRLTPRHRSGGPLLDRPVSRGIQTYDTVGENYPLTQPVIKLEALMQTSGQALYQNDIHQKHDTDLWCAFVQATVINATILNIDPAPALVSYGKMIK